MKNLTKAEKSQAIKRVYAEIKMYNLNPQSIRNALYRRYDQRTRVSKYAHEYFNKLISDGFDLISYKVKRINRSAAMARKLHPTQKYIKNSLFKDYRKHRKDVVGIEDNRIVFSTRFRYANTEEDFKVLQVLKKHFKK